MPTVIHLRAETKKFERRSPRKALLEAGYIVRIERSTDRIYKDAEYEAIGAQLIPAGSWIGAPTEDIILGLKELSPEGDPLTHEHIHFQHAFKRQDDWVSALLRFVRGSGKLYDLEFLTDENGRRVAAFGYWAGYAGTAVALLSWAHQILYPGTAQGPMPSFDSATLLVEHVNAATEPALSVNGGVSPRIIVIGALGRYGTCAVDFARAAGTPESSILQWDLNETKAGGPFKEIVESDIFANCVYLGPNRAPPFITFDSLTATEDRRLRVICDVSCDPNSENNPIPVYSSYSSFEKPTIPTSREVTDPELRVVAIDHLPTLVAREASDEFSQLLLPSLLKIDRRREEGVWKRAEKVFNSKIQELPGGTSGP